MTLTDVSIPNVYNLSDPSTTKSLTYSEYGGELFNFASDEILSNTTQYITNLYNWKLNSRVNGFESELSAWKYKTSIPEQDLDKVSLFGDIKLTNWKYDSLRLASKAVPFAVIENKTRTEKIADTLQKFIKIISDQGILKKKFWLQSNTSTYNLQMNKTDFDNYKKNNNTFGDTFDYLSSKLHKLALSKNIINNNDYFDLFKNDYSLETKTFQSKILNEYIVNNKFQYKTSEKWQTSIYLNINGTECFIDFYNKYTYSVERVQDDNVWPIA